MLEDGSEVRAVRWGNCLACGLTIVDNEIGYACPYCDRAVRQGGVHEEVHAGSAGKEKGKIDIRLDLLSRIRTALALDEGAWNTGLIEGIDKAIEGSRDMKMTMYMVEFREGSGLFSYYGPFPTADEAAAWARTTHKLFSVLPLEAPWTEIGGEDARQE